MALTRVRIAVVGALGAVVALLSGRIFDATQLVVVVGAVLPAGAAAATAGARSTVRLGAAAGAVVVAVVTAVLVAGGQLPDDLVDAVVRGPARVLSTEWPSPATADLVGAVAVVVAAATALAAWLARSTRWHLAPLLPVVAAYVAVVGASAPAGPALLGAAALLVGGGVLAAVGSDGSPRQRLAALAAERQLVPLVGAAVVVGVVAALVLSVTGRADPRADAPPPDRAEALDPIEAVTALRRLDPPIDLFRVELDGTATARRWRTAAVEVYDGEQWRSDVTLRPIGRRLAPDGERTMPVGVEFVTDDLDLVPLPGDAVTLDAAVETDAARDVVRTVDRPAPGARVRGTVDLLADIDDAVGGDVATRPVDDAAAAFTSAARGLVEPATVLEQLRQLEATMRDDFALDPDAPGAGVQQTLLERFVRDTRRGSAEQFVAAFVLLARSLGVDARIASGFIVPDDELAPTVTLRSDLAALWPEVRVEGVGWVPFDPVPPDEASDVAPPAPPPRRQTPAAPQPPVVPPAEPDDDPPDDDEADDAVSAGWWAAALRWAVRIGAATGIVVIPIVAVVALILWLKRRRRRRLLAAPTPNGRARGAWAAANDALTDAGLTVDATWTDLRTAAEGGHVAPGAEFELSGLAGLSAAATFGSGFDADPTPYAVACLAVVDAAVLDGRTRRRRAAYHLSTRSLRRRTRSPIAAAIDVRTPP